MAGGVFEQHAEAILARIVRGASLADAARLHGVGARTVSSWIEKGRRDPDGAYGDFARQVDEARAERRLPSDADELDEDELRRVVARSARAGNVQAAKFYFDTWIKGTSEGVTDGIDPLAEVDELARKRVAR